MDPAMRLLFDRYDPAAKLLFVKRNAPTILGRKRSRSTSSTSTSMPPPSTSDQRPRKEKSAPYWNAQYPLVLETMGSYMKGSPLGIADTSRSLCKTLLNTQQPTPKNSLFDDDIFEKVCNRLQDKNGDRIVLDLLRLIVPSAEQHALRAKHVKEQMDKLWPFIGDSFPGDQSFFMATHYMYFPFLICEAKCGMAALDIADRQNAHSMTLAVRAVVELFRLVKREDEVNRQILAFSISYDDSSVRIYGHYPVINGKDTKYYRRLIHGFWLPALEGRDKWTAYQFVKNVYDIWAPDHFKNICSAIDQLPIPMQSEQLPTATPIPGFQSLDMPIAVGNV